VLFGLRVVIVEPIIVVAVSRWRIACNCSYARQRFISLASKRSAGSLEQPAPSALHIAVSLERVLKGTRHG
jgi:hypothetical protein